VRGTAGLARAIASLDPAQAEIGAPADPDVPNAGDQPDRDPR
jgi:hypothetical protein